MNTRKSLLCRIAIIDGFIQQLVGMKGKFPSNEINLALSDLNISKDALIKDLANVDILTQFKDYPWVIKNNISQPTYYQLVSIVDKVVTLSRKGILKVITLKEFYRDFVEATEEQVLQHINYLNKKGFEYLFKPVPCDKSPIIDFSAGFYNSIPATELRTDIKKSKDANFFMVTLKQGYGSKVYHQSYEIAEAEAIRLSKQENKKAYVLGVVGEFEAIPTTTYEIKKTKY